jgi:hypothetical protein
MSAKNARRRSAAGKPFPDNTSTARITNHSNDHFVIIAMTALTTALITTALIISIELITKMNECQ